MRWGERVIGVLLGLLLGVAIVIGFVFWGSNALIDSASLSEGKGAGQHPHHGRKHPGPPAAPPVRTVHVIGGAPPETGAPTFDYRKGDRVRIEVVSDSTVGVELLGYGIQRTVPANRPTLIELTASKPGNFPLIVTASHIGVADIRVGEGPAR